MNFYKVTYRQGKRTIVVNCWAVARNSDYVTIATELGRSTLKIPSYQVISIKLYPYRKGR